MSELGERFEDEMIQAALDEGRYLYCLIHGCRPESDLLALMYLFGSVPMADPPRGLGMYSGAYQLMLDLRAAESDRNTVKENGMSKSKKLRAMVNAAKATETTPATATPAPAPTMGMVMAAVTCPKCKRELRLDAAGLAEWCATRCAKCPVCGEQFQPDTLHLADVLRINIGTIECSAPTRLTVRPPEAPVAEPVAETPEPAPIEDAPDEEVE